MSITYAGQIVREAPEIEAYKLGLLKSAQAQVAKPLALPAYESAGLQALQNQAVGTAQAYGTKGLGIGGYAPFLQGASGSLGAGTAALQAAGKGISGINVNPFFNAAQLGMTEAATAAGKLGQFSNVVSGGYGNLAQGSSSLGSGATTLADAGKQISGMNVDPYFNTANLGFGEAATAAGKIGGFSDAVGRGFGNIAQGSTTLGDAGKVLGGAAQGFDPAMVKPFMNPYQQQVIDEALKQINRQGEMQQRNLSAQAVKSGAFGGTREGVQRAELGRNLAEAQNQAIVGGLQQGYGQALGSAQQAFDSQQARQGQVGQAFGQLGALQSNQGMLGAQLAAQQAGLLGQQAQLQSGVAQGVGALGAQQGQLALAKGQGLGQIGQAQGQLGSLQSNQGILGAQLAGQQAGIFGQQAQLQSGIAQGLGSLGGQQAQTALAQGQGLGQIGMGLGQIGMNQAQLGGMSQQLAQGDMNTYMSLGALQQGTEQNRLDAFRATQTQKAMMPYQQIGFMSDIYKGAPTSQSTLTGMTAPSTNPLLQAAGLGIAGLGAASAAKNVGLFG